jgi:hypothetical protein
MDINTKIALYFAKGGIRGESQSEEFLAEVNMFYRLGKITAEERDRLC